MVDGEDCVLDDLGRSDFCRLQDRARRRRWYAGCDQVTLLFDLLVQGGRSIMDLPLTERRHRLVLLFASVRKAAVLFVSELPADGELYERLVLPLEL